MPPHRILHGASLIVPVLRAVRASLLSTRAIESGKNFSHISGRLYYTLHKWTNPTTTIYIYAKVSLAVGASAYIAKSVCFVLFFIAYFCLQFV